jgi:hypothetical protein
MEIHESQADCQMPSLRQAAVAPDVSHRRTLKQLVRSYLGPRRTRAVERYANDLRNWYARLRGRETRPVSVSAYAQSTPLKAGDPVRVRSMEEIEETLNHSRRLKGCSFVPEMGQYCGTVQRVLKPVERFVDERDYRVWKTRGIVLLEGLTCQGTGNLGRCDRSCYFFWREEWLERID